MMDQKGWKPLLQGKACRTAQQAVEHVVKNLSRLPRRSTGSVRDPSLAGGKAGEALFWLYWSRATGDPAAADQAFGCLEEAAGALADQALSASLYGGFSGIGWVVEHAHGSLFEDGAEDLNQDVDSALLQHLDQSPWTGDYDLVGGLVGYGVYALERLPSPAARQCLQRVVEHLAEYAVEQADGWAWFTPARLLHASQAPKYPLGYFNLGLAHGVPGPIAILAAACRAGVAASTARPVLEGAVSWLLSQRLEEGLFPGLVASNHAPVASRLAWCYGNPGVAVALLAAARCVGDQRWEEAALAIARAAARRPVESSGVRDAGLCHGSAGLGHLFNRLYQATGDEVCGAAARFWLGQALEFMCPDDWPVGFPSWEIGTGEELEEQEHAGIVTGVTGVGLALLAASTDLAPDWDRFLLASVPC